MAVTETILTASGDTIAIDTDVFRARLSTMLREHRRDESVRLRTLARRSNGRFSTRQLRDVENGTVSELDAAELAALYGADLSAILPARSVVEVDPAGRISTAGIIESFEPGDDTAVLTAYLRLVRRLRQQQRAPVVALRRDDIDVLAEALAEPGERVVDRLGALMGATQVQRKLMVGLFVSGAVVIGLAVTAVAATTGDVPDSGTTVPAAATTVANEALTTEPVAEQTADPVVDADAAADADRAADPGGSQATVEFPPLRLEDPPRAVEPSTPEPADTAPANTAPSTEPAPPDTVATQPPPVPTPTAPAEPPPTVAVGPPPVPTTAAPIVEPIAPVDPVAPPPEPEPEPDEPIVATGPPPVPTATIPIPGG